MSNGQKSPCRRSDGRRGIRRFGIPALVLIGLLRVDSGDWVPRPAPVWTLYTTHVGNTAKVTLQDGSSVDLNTDTEIEVRFTGKRREVVLIHGEALFNVVQHPDWPFAVRAGVATIRATGTKLSIRLREEDREDNQTDVLVVKGGVSIDGDTGFRHVGYARGAPRFVLTAFSGELVSMNSTSVLARTELTPGALERRTAWTDGWLWFAKDPLPEAVAQFNRYHRQHLVLVDPTLATLEIGGRFRSTDLESFLATLEHSFNVRRVHAAAHGTGAETIYLTGRCGRAQQQCNWSLVQ